VNPQKIARVTGVLFVITFIASIPPVLFLYGPLLDDPRYILGGGAADNGASLGALLELILIIANIGTAIVLYPVVKRVNEILALGFVTARVIESAFIAVGILSILTLVTLRQEAAGADAASLLAVGQSLVALQGWTFLLGPGFVVGIGNGLILGYLMYRSGLVPRGLAMVGLIAGPVLLARFVGILFGAFEPMSVLGSLMVVPEFVWELGLGIWLIVKGFNASAVASLSTTPDDGVLTGAHEPDRRSA
jgi:hypothetical protein